MRSFILIGLIALTVITVSGREIRLERKIRKFSVIPLKDKRGTGDYSSQSHSSGQPSYFTPVNAPIGGHSNGGSAGTYSLGHIGSSGIESIAGYGGHTLGPGHVGGLNFATLSLGPHGGGQTSYALQSIPYGSSSLTSSVSKTGPVTFGTSPNQMYVSPIYTTGVQGLSGYTAGSGHGMNIPIFSLGNHGLSLASSGSQGYNSPAAVPSSIYSNGHGLSLASSGSHNYRLSAPSSSSHSVSGGLLISPTTSQGSSSSYNAAGHPNAMTSHESSPSYHVGLSSGSSSDNSNYQLPVSSSSYSTDSTSYSGYKPASSEGHSYSSTGNAGYSQPNNDYSSSSTSYSSPSSSYSNGQTSSYISGNSPATSASYSQSSVSYSAPSSSYSSPSRYSNQPTSIYGSPSEQQGSYSQTNPAYFSYAVAAPKYDTISYSSSNE